MSERVREAVKGGIGGAVGMAILDMLNGKLGVDTVYRAAFVAVTVTVFSSVVSWIFRGKKSSLTRNVRGDER